MADNALWLPINKKIGPAAFERVGITYKDGSVTLLLDASLQTGPLNMALLGLEVAIPIDSFEPRFALQGLGIR